MTGRFSGRPALTTAHLARGTTLALVPLGQAQDFSRKKYSIGSKSGMAYYIKVTLILTMTTRRRKMEGQQLGYVGLEEAARRLGVGYWRVRHAHRAGHVPEPPRIGNRRVYDQEMLARLRAYFAAKESNRGRSGEAEANPTEPGRDARP
jgi:hypothetical protein